MSVSISKRSASAPPVIAKVTAESPASASVMRRGRPRSGRSGDGGGGGRRVEGRVLVVDVLDGHGHGDRVVVGAGEPVGDLDDDDAGVGVELCLAPQPGVSKSSGRC